MSPHNCATAKSSLTVTISDAINPFVGHRRPT